MSTSPGLSKLRNQVEQLGFWWTVGYRSVVAFLIGDRLRGRAVDVSPPLLTAVSGWRDAGWSQA